MVLALGPARAARLHLHTPAIRRLEGAQLGAAREAGARHTASVCSHPSRPACRQGHGPHARHAGHYETREVSGRPGAALRRELRRPCSGGRDRGAPECARRHPALTLHAARTRCRRLLNVKTDLGERILILGDAAQAIAQDAKFVSGTRVSLEGVFVSRGAGAVRVVSGQPIAKAQYCFVGNGINKTATSLSAVRAAAAQMVTCECPERRRRGRWAAGDLRG